MDWKKISVIVGLVLTLSGTIYKGITSANATVNKIDNNSSEISKLDIRMNIKDLKEQLYELRRERNFLRDQIRRYPNDQNLKRRLVEIEEEIKDIKQRIREVQ